MISAGNNARTEKVDQSVFFTFSQTYIFWSKPTNFKKIFRKPKIPKFSFLTNLEIFKKPSSQLEKHTGANANVR